LVSDVCLHDDATAAGSRIVAGTDFVLISINKVDMHVGFPLVVYLSDGDQLDSLPLRDRYRINVKGVGSTFLELHDRTFTKLQPSGHVSLA